MPGQKRKVLATTYKMLCDPTAAFTNAIGLSLDLADFGLGVRSERYSMIVDDGVVSTVNVEESILACAAQ